MSRARVEREATRFARRAAEAQQFGNRAFCENSLDAVDCSIELCMQGAQVEMPFDTQGAGIDAAEGINGGDDVKYGKRIGLSVKHDAAMNAAASAKDFGITEFCQHLSQVG